MLDKNTRKVQIDLEEGVHFNVGDLLQSFKVGRAVEGLGQVVRPTGILVVTSVQDAGVVATVSAEFDRLMVGQRIRLTPSFNLTRGRQAQDVESNLWATILGFNNDLVLQGFGAIAFLYVGEGQGVTIGDEFMAYVNQEDGWAGEEAVREALADHAILRTAWLYGAHGRNFLKTILRAALRKPDAPLRIVNDQFGSPTWSHRLALQLQGLFEQGRGLYHATAEGSCTWFELASTFLDALGVACPLEPCTSDAYPTPARRPLTVRVIGRRPVPPLCARTRPTISSGCPT